MSWSPKSATRAIRPASSAITFRRARWRYFAGSASPQSCASRLARRLPNDAAYRTSATGIELCRIEIPGRSTRYSATGGPDTWWPTPEPPHRINQVYLEPILFSHAAAQPRITILARTEIVAVEQDDGDVVALARNLDDGSSLQIAASFVVGCDGSRSLVRKSIGASLSGTPVIQRVQSTYIEAPALGQLMSSHKPAWMVLSLNPRRSGTTVAIDGHDRWLIHNHLKPNEPEFERSTATGPSAPSSASTNASNTGSSARRTGSVAGWWPIVSVTGGYSSAAMPRICGCPMQAMA